MCAQYLIKTSLKNIEAFFGIEISSDIDSIDERIMPAKKGPVLVMDQDKYFLRDMRFGLIPAWSKDGKVKFATHNARIESVAEKPTWKRPFESRRALIPITRFIEPIYTGSFAGNMVQFHDPKDSTLFAAGIWDEWTDKQSGEVLESFSIITGEPPAFVAKIGHDRCPLFLKRDIADEWLEPTKKSAESLIKLLRGNIAKLELEVEVDRPMRPGWEKRIPKE